MTFPFTFTDKKKHNISLTFYMYEKYHDFSWLFSIALKIFQGLETLISDSKNLYAVFHNQHEPWIKQYSHQSAISMCLRTSQ